MPPGRALHGENTDKLIASIAAELQPAYADMQNALYAPNPKASLEMLAQWEIATDKKTQQAVITLLNKPFVRTIADINAALYPGLAAQRVIERRAARASLARTGDECDLAAVITLANPREQETVFRTGSARSGDYLNTIEEGEDFAEQYVNAAVPRCVISTSRILFQQSTNSIANAVDENSRSQATLAATGNASPDGALWDFAANRTAPDADKSALSITGLNWHHGGSIGASGETLLAYAEFTHRGTRNIGQGEVLFKYGIEYCLLYGYIAGQPAREGDLILEEFLTGAGDISQLNAAPDIATPKGADPVTLRVAFATTIYDGSMEMQVFCQPAATPEKIYRTRYLTGEPANPPETLEIAGVNSQQLFYRNAYTGTMRGLTLMTLPAPLLTGNFGIPLVRSLFATID